MKKFITTITITLLFKSLSFAQTYEFNQLKQIPFIDEANMKIIAFSVQKLFDDAIKEPQRNSTVEATTETVYGYYDLEGNDRLTKVESTKGNQYVPSNIEDLKKDNSLLFNLIFDINGNLIVPKTIYVIFNRKETQSNRTIKRVGLLAFSLTVSDSIKDELSKVKLRRLAKINGNSLTGGLSPVQVKIPFQFSYSHNLIETTGHVVKNNSQIDLSIDRNYRPDENREEFINLIEKQSEILDYKKGSFEFVVSEDDIKYDMDFTLYKGMVYSNQQEEFSNLSEKKIKSFSGTGKKIKK